jgi:hypothetical protein
MDVAATARAALDVLRADGWCKYALVDDNGAHCAGGALNMAHHGDWWWQLSTLHAEPLAALIRAEYPAYDDPGRSACSVIAMWNNAPDRTWEQVEAIFEKLAAG